MMRLSGRNGSARRPRSLPTGRCTAMTIPEDPIGPEPTRDTPDQRAAWHEAFLALGPAGEPDVRAMRDGRLWLIQGHLAPAETAWAPRHVGRELRLARLGAVDADQSAIRAAAEADAAREPGDHARAGRHGTGCLLSSDGRQLSAARNCLRPDHDRPAGVGARHRPFPPPGRAGPTPNCAAATPDLRIKPLHSAEPVPSATLTATNWSWPRTRRSVRWPPGSAT